jgi:hypothetical protein
MLDLSQALALGKLTQEDHELEARLHSKNSKILSRKRKEKKLDLY